jgi:hypothetical protein
MLSGVSDDAARPLEPETAEDLRRQFLERNTGRGVIDHAFRQDTRADHSPLAGYTAWNPLDVGAFAPIDHVHLHTAANLAHVAAGSSFSSASYWSIPPPRGHGHGSRPPPSPGGTLYVKFTADAVTEFLLLSFKEKDNG